MKRILLLALLLISVTSITKAGDKDKKEDNTEIHWITLDELQVKMKEQPRKVYMDVYTDWCGWCKVMEKKTFTNPSVIKYFNANFYAVRLNAERKDTIQFAGKTYYYEPQYKANTLAVELLKGTLSFPTSVFMLEDFQNPQPIPGYLEVGNIEKVARYFGDNTFKHITWPEYDKTFKSSWQ
jgi:thioredoxin-related protein